MEEQDYQQQQMYNQPQGYMASPVNLYGGAIEKLTDPEDEMYKMELTLRGYKLSHSGQAIPMGEPLISDEGISSMIGIIQGLVQRSGIIGFVEKNDRNVLLMEMSDTIIKDLMVNRLKYKITNPSARDRILNIATSNAFVTLNRSLDGGDRRFWKGSQQDIRTEVVNAGANKSFLSKLNPFAR